jgi:hypothetical protein
MSTLIAVFATIGIMLVAVFLVGVFQGWWRHRAEADRLAVLEAVRRLQPNGRGFTIDEEVKRILGRRISFGSLFVILDELERSGAVASRWGQPSQATNGRRPRLYWIAEPSSPEVTRQGEKP